MKSFEIGNVHSALILGGSGGIGHALVKQILALNPNCQIFTTFRTKNPHQKLSELAENSASKIKIKLIHFDAQQASSYEELADTLKETVTKIDLCINTVGFLHDQQDIQPEKKLSDINLTKLQHSFEVNAFPIVLLAKCLQTFFKNNQLSVFASLSARVGSIADNRLGGWYSYRAAKAAHNMFIKNISLEYERFKCNTIVLALHPGTTKTKLSEPFISLTQYQLHDPEATATHLLKILHGKNMADNGKFIDWQGKDILW